MKPILIFFVSSLIAFHVPGQVTDSLLKEKIRFNSLRQKNEHLLFNNYSKCLSLKSLKIPSALITYGFIGLEAETLEYINKEIKEEIKENNPNFRTRADHYLQFAPAAGVFLLEAGGIKGKHNLKDKAIIYGMALVIMTTVVYSLKTITHQMRPDGSKYNSFPSRHTANAFMGAEFLKQEYSFRSSLYGYSGYAAAAGTGVLRMYNNKHWFTDIVTGAGLGILSAKLSYWIFGKIERNRNRKSLQFNLAFK